MSTPELPRYGPPPGQSSADPLPDQPPTAPMPYEPASFEPAPGQPQYPQGQYPPGQPAYPYPYSAPPGYGQPGAAPYPPYPYPYPQPQKRSNRGVWIAIGSVIGAIVLCGVVCAIGFGLFFSQFGNVIAPLTTASLFCSYEEQSDYTSSWNLLSASMQGRVGETEWVQANQAREQSNGVVQACRPVSSGMSVTNSSASMQLQLTLNDGQHSGQITMVREGGQWKIDSIDSGLGIAPQALGSGPGAVPGSIALWRRMPGA